MKSSQKKRYNSQKPQAKHNNHRYKRANNDQHHGGDCRLRFEKVQPYLQQYHVVHQCREWQ